MILVFLLTFLYGTVFILGKLALEVCPPFFLTGVRMLIGGIVSLFLFYAVERKSLKSIIKLPSYIWKQVLILSIVNIYIPNSYEFWGLQYLSAGKSAFIYNLTPFFSAGISYIFLKEYMTINKFIGLLIACVGFVPLLVGVADVADITFKIGYISLAELALVLASFSTAFGYVLMRVMSKEETISPFLFNGVSMIVGSVFCFIHAHFAEGAPYVLPENYLRFIVLATLTSLILNVICFNLCAFLLRRYTATFILFASFMAPLWAAILGYFFLHEEVSMLFIVSSSLVFVGLVIFYQQELKQGYVVKHHKK